MRDWSHRPALAFTALCFCSAVAANLYLVNWKANPVMYAAGSLLLAAPFAVLLIGQIQFARTWRRSTFLVLGNVPFGALWLCAFFAMLWLQPGLTGLVLFGGVLGVLAAGYALLSKYIKER